MNKKILMTTALVAGSVAVAIAGATKADAANDKEKCYGVVKAGHNDCADANDTHSCMSQAGEDGDGAEWIALPKGVCERLVGGSIEPKE